MPAEVRISVIIPCRGGAARLARCLESVAPQATALRGEVVVVDSGPDAAVVAAARRFPGVRVISPDRALRAGPARNLGVEQSAARFLAFIDADCTAGAGWLPAALRGLETGARMCGGPVLDAHPWHPTAAMDNLMQFAAFGPARPAGPARFFPGCNLAVDREAFVDVGGFPDVPLSSGEDTALCNAFLARWPGGLQFIPGMRVSHDGRTTFREFLAHQRAFGHSRGVMALHLSAAQQRLGRLTIAVPAVVLKRLGFIVGRVAAWDPRKLPRVAVFLPALVAGLVAWAIGFRQGCREANVQPAAATRGSES